MVQLKNDATELIFVGERHRVSLESLKSLCAELGSAAAFALGKLGAAQTKVDFELLASPRYGSIIIVLQPVFYFNLDTTSFVARAADEIKSQLEELGSLAAIGAFVWQVLFGGNGIFDLFKRKVQVSDLPQTPKVSNLEYLLRQKLLSEEDREFRHHLQTIVNLAAGAGADAVKIRVDDSDAIALWDRSSRTEPGLLFSSRLFNRPVPLFVRRISEPIRGSYLGKPVQIFAGEGFAEQNGGINRVIVVWASAHPIPDPGETTARYVKAQLLMGAEGLEVLDEIPAGMEGADAVILVREAANMG
jgi:hypothetical protein